MREIKYKVWDKELKIMGQVVKLESVISDDDLFNVVSYVDDAGIEREVAMSDCILLQYTGLKDKNGKGIYEGNIVKCEKRGYAFYRSVVKYNDELARFDVFTGNCAFPMTLEEAVDDISITGADYEVIGNIYES